MDDLILARYRAFFLEQRKRLECGFGLASESFKASPDEMTDETDMAMTGIETGMRMRLRQREALYLRKVEEALRRMDAGTFGLCGACGDEIDPRRLEARPIATHCFPCKEESERREQLHIDSHRPGRRARLA